MCKITGSYYQQNLCTSINLSILHINLLVPAKVRLYDSICLLTIINLANIEQCKL